jgi:uncharacterized protein (UPF0332 family)
MNGSDFIVLAGRLVAIHGGNAAALRTAVSRAYYGSFHLASDLLLACNASIPDKGHNLDRYLQASGFADAVAAGAILGDLHEWRVRADYRFDNQEVESQAVATSCVEDAQEVQSLLLKCHEPSAKAAIKAGIENYLRRIGRL